MVEQAEHTEASAAASQLSERGASKGGAARAAALAPARKSEIARQAALARWDNTERTTMKATHEGALVFGDKEISCAVTEDGTRLITNRSFLAALDRPRMGHQEGKVMPLLEAKNLQPFISDELRQWAEPVMMKPLRQAKKRGFHAHLLPDVCEVYLDARAAGVLTERQMKVARAAEILVRGMAKVGIVALIDEATGYQEVRARDELQQLLEKYVHEELRPWTKRFPDDFFREIFRLHGWEYHPESTARPSYVGSFINRYIYKQLPPGVLPRIEDELNPKNGNGNRSRRHHQFLTDATGVPHLDKLISNVTMLMRISVDKAQFQELFERAYVPQQKLPLVIDVDSPG